MPCEQELLDRILGVLKFKSKGMTITEISHITNTHRNSIAKYLQILLASGRVDMEIIGNAKVYTLSNRVPISSILHYSPYLIVLLNQERKIIQVNDKYLKYFGFDEKDLLYKEIYNKNIPIPILNEKTLMPLIDGSFVSGKINSKEITYTHDNKQYSFFIKYIPTILEEEEQCLIIIIKDCTEEKRIREELSRNEEQFKNLFNNANDSIFLYEITKARRIGKLIEVNDTACKKLNYTRDEFVRTKFSEIFNSEFQNTNFAIRNDLAENNHSTYEGIQVKKDGTTFPVEVSAHSFSLQDKPVILYIMKDISERKITENSLKLSDSRYRDIVEGQQELICRISPDQSIHYGNEAFRKYFDIQNGTIEGKTLESLNIHPDDIESIQTYMNTANTKNQSKNIEFCIYQQGRKPRWIESRITPIFDIDHTIHEFQLIGRDITETKLSKEALKRNEENTQFLLNSINDNSFLIDLNGYILSVNKPSCEYIRNFCADESLNSKSITGRSIYDFMPEDINRIIRKIASEIINSKKSKLFLKAIDNQIFDFSLSPIVNSDGKVEKIVVIKRKLPEITDYKANFPHPPPFN